MLVIQGRNVNDIFARGVDHLRRYGALSSSRAGEVLVLDTPVMSIYEKPCERVLFDLVRDANPFFHLFESIWMLAGRDDAAFLNTYVRDFGERFAEKTGNLHGAYGRRWRFQFNDIDQIEVCVERLRRDQCDRRAVISMWNPEFDLDVEAKDLPCNTHIYPRVVDGRLDLTVMCRSNDIIWGAYGANAVHFSVLQEYMAAGVGVEVGRLYQLSNNWHAYVDVLERQVPELCASPYQDNHIFPFKMINHYPSFYEECRAFCDSPTSMTVANNRWFLTTPVPMARAHELYREKKYEKALATAAEIAASDWRLVATRWIERRVR